MKDDENIDSTLEEFDENNIEQNNFQEGELLQNTRSSSNSKVPERLREIRNGRKNYSKSRTNSSNKKNNKDEEKLKNKISDNKQKNSFLSKFRKKKKDNKNSNSNKENSENNSTQNEDNSAVDNNDENTALEDVKKVTKKIRIIRRIVIFVPTIFFLFLLLVIILTILAVISGIFGSPFSININDPNSVINSNDSASYQKEVKYYKKLNEVKEKYQQDCSSELNINYIHAIMITYYYKIDFDIDSIDQNFEFVDYGRMADNVDKIYNLLSNTCTIDYSINGNFYNNLKNSSDFKNYYKDILKTADIDDLLKEIFELGSTIDIENDFDDINNEPFIPDSVKVITNTNTYSNIGNNNSQTTDLNSNNVSFKTYLQGDIYANVDAKDYNNSEKMKAFTIIYTTNTLAKNTLSTNLQTINLNNSDIDYCDVNSGCSYIVKNGIKKLQSGGGDSGNGNNIYYNGKYYYKTPLSSDTSDNISKTVEDIYGYVLVDKDGKYVTADIALLNNVTGSSYVEMLSKAYPNLTLKNIRENVYDNGVNYGNAKVQAKVVFYDQNDYSGSVFCGRTNPKATIKTSGCGVTAMAIIASTYENSNKYDPVYMSSEAQKGGYCGYNIAGTSTAFFKREANVLGYRYLKVGKSKVSDKNLVTSHLSKGDLVIAHMGPGKFTSSGHYIVLSGIDADTKSVYVSDPYNKANKASSRKSGNGWYSFNTITSQAYAFYIIWKG